MEFYHISEKTDERLYFGITFQGTTLGDPIETSYELFIDRFPDKDTEGTDGERMAVWTNFYPDYRFRIEGKNGRIEKMLYSTSLGVVIPSFTFSIPSSIMGTIPSLIDCSLISTAVAPLTSICLI